MEVKVDGKVYVVSFDHIKSYGQSKDIKAGPLVPCGTKCTISSVKGKHSTVISTGYSRVAKGDQFSRSTGRKVSLHKALTTVWPESAVVYSPESGIKKSIAPKKNRIMRTGFWKAYLKHIASPTS